MTKWYIVNVVAGQENKICDDINAIAKQNEYIKEAFIPTKKVFKQSPHKSCSLIMFLLIWI